MSQLTDGRTAANFDRLNVRPLADLTQKLEKMGWRGCGGFGYGKHYFLAARWRRFVDFVGIFRAPFVGWRALNFCRFGGLWP